MKYKVKDVGMKLLNVSWLHTAIPTPTFRIFGTAIPTSLYTMKNVFYTCLCPFFLTQKYTKGGCCSCKLLSEFNKHFSDHNSHYYPSVREIQRQGWAWVPRLLKLGRCWAPSNMYAIHSSYKDADTTCVYTVWKCADTYTTWLYLQCEYSLPAT